MTIFNRIYGDEDLPVLTSAFVVNDPLVNVKRKVFEVSVTHMHGDADYYSHSVHDFNNATDLLEFVNFMLKCMYAYPNGMRGDARYDHIEGYDKWSNVFYSDNEHWDGHASINKISVVYYDAEGVAHDAHLS